MQIVEISTTVFNGLPITVKGYSYDRRTIEDFAVVGCGRKFGKPSKFDWINRKLTRDDIDELTSKLEQELRDS